MMPAQDQHTCTAPEWAIAVLTARESPRTLASAVESVLFATKDRHATVDVIVNGNAELARSVAAHWLPGDPEIGPQVSLRIWSVAKADKAHAWNEYAMRIRPPGADFVFFIDGYVAVAPDALQRIEDGLASAPQALGATGVPTQGASARTLRESMLRHGGIHGNLYAIRGSIMNRLIAGGFRFPQGIYRSDPLLGAVLCFDLDPSVNRWDSRRILVEKDAIWTIVRERAPGHRLILANIKRLARQAQGVLENKAVRQHLAVEKLGPAILPEHVSDLILAWVRKHPLQAAGTILRNPLTLHTMVRMARTYSLPVKAGAPVLIAEVGPTDPSHQPVVSDVSDN